jgi:hypothetical protein
MGRTKEELGKRACHVCGKEVVEIEHHFLLHIEAYNHIKKGAKLQNTNLETTFQEGHVADTNM